MFRLEKLSDKAVLTIYGYVGGYYLDFRAVEQALHEIKSDGFRQLDFWMHTYGGDVFEGNMIRNFMDSFCANGEIDLYCPGVLASMGSVLMEGATRRHLAENGFVMIHAPSGGCNGNAKDHQQTAKLLQSMERNFCKGLSRITGKKTEDVAQWMDGTDYWFDAEECLKLGLITSIIAPQVTDLADLSLDDAQTMGAQAVYSKFSALTTVQKPNKSNMDKARIIAMYGLTGVTAQSSDAEVFSAMEAKKAESDQKTATAQAEAKAEREKRENQESESVASAVAQAVKEGKIVQGKTDEYTALGKTIGATALAKIFADMGGRTPIAKQVSGKQTANAGEDRTGWKWGDYMAKAPDDLESMPDTDPETFCALYKAEFGCEPPK